MLNHKRENDVTGITSAAPQSPYVKPETIAQVCKPCQDLTKGDHRSLNPDPPRNHQRADGWSTGRGTKPERMPS
jgi:hypothetical protein